METTNILVIGGAGFVGSALCKQLEAEGHNVTSLDNYFTGSKLNHHDGIEYIEGTPHDLTELWSEPVFDYVFHLGEYARVEQSFNDFDTVMSSNYHQFPKVLEFCKLQDAKLIYSGSSTKFSVGEDGQAMSPYAYTKANNTNLLQNYAKWYGLDYTIVYFYNVYGDHEIGQGKYATVVAKFLDIVKGGHRTLPVTSPGTQLRNFTHIDDIVAGLILAGFQGSGDGYGIGSDEKYSILDLVEMLKAQPIMTEEKPGNRMDGVLKTEKLKELGWSCQRSLPEYIKGKL
jgi:UDP-glucose 4-epimerase